MTDRILIRMRLTLRAALAVLCVSVALSVAANAQDAAVPDYSEWDLRARADEAKIDLDTASTAELEAIRARLVGWRSEFLAAQDINAERIETVRAQIEAMGPAPLEGTEEPAEIATRREELSVQLAQLRAPGLKAEEAYTRAHGLIGQIDKIIRDRQANAFLELGASPLNPGHWPGAINQLAASLMKSGQEIATNLGSDRLWAEARRNLPLILVLLVAGGMLIGRGKPWALKLVDQLGEGQRRGTELFRSLVSLGQIILPYSGVYALIEAMMASGFVGPRVSVLLEHLQLWVALILGVRWLAKESFHSQVARATFALASQDKLGGRRLANSLVWLYVLHEALLVLADTDDYASDIFAVLVFPLLLLAGYVVFRLGRLVCRAQSSMSVEGGAENGFRDRVTRLLGQAAQVVGIIGPIMAAIGYLNFGQATVYPMAASFGLFALVLVLQRLVYDLSDFFTRTIGTSGESLLPVVGAFILSAAALPCLALIWGARTADLSELLTRFWEGFVIGETRISPTDFLVVILVFVVGLMATRLLQGALKTSVLPKTKMDPGAQIAISSGVGYIGVFLAAVLAITAGGLDLSSLAIVAGALSVGIGFGLQNIVSNFVSGIILLIERPISEGDWIEVNGTHGIVKNISVRSTRLETFDKYSMIIPNADFVSGTVSNYTRGNSLGRIVIPVGVAYGTDTRKVERILTSIVRAHDDVLMNPEPAVDFIGFGADSLDFQIRAVLYDINKGMGVRTEIRHLIVERFAEEGIEMPFAQRDIWLRNPEDLWRPSHSDQSPAQSSEDPQ